MKVNTHKDVAANKGSEFAQKFKKLVWEFPEVERVSYLDGELTIDVQEEEKSITPKLGSKYFELNSNNYQRTNWRELLGKKEFVIFVDSNSHLEPYYLTVKSPSKKRSSFSFDSIDGEHKLYSSNFFEETVKQTIDFGNTLFLFDSKMDVLDYLCADDLKRTPSISTTSVFAFRYRSDVYTLVYVDGGWGFQNTILSIQEQPVLFWRKTPFLSDYISELCTIGIDLQEFKSHADFRNWVNTYVETSEDQIFTLRDIESTIVSSWEPSQEHIYCIVIDTVVYKLGRNETFGAVDFYSENGVSVFREEHTEPISVLISAFSHGHSVCYFKKNSVFKIWEERLEVSGNLNQHNVEPEPKQEPAINSLSKYQDLINSSNAAMFFMVRREFLKNYPNKHFLIENELNGKLSHYELVRYDYQEKGKTEYWGFKNIMKSGLDEEIKHCENLWTNSVREAVDQGDTVYVLTHREYCEWLGLREDYPEPPTEVQEGTIKSHPTTGTAEPELPYIGFKFNGVAFRLVKVVGTYGFLCCQNLGSSLLFKENFLPLDEYISKLARTGILLTECINESEFQNWILEDHCNHNSFVLDENSPLPDENDWSLDKYEIVLIYKNETVNYLHRVSQAHGEFYYFISSAILEPNLFSEITFKSFRNILEYAVKQGLKLLHFNNKGAHKIWLQILESKNPPMGLYPEPSVLEEQLVEASSAVEDFEHNVKAKPSWDSTKICAYEFNGEVFKLVQEVDKLFPNYCNNYAFVSLKDCFLPSTLTYLTSPEECINEVTSCGHRVYEFETEENFKLWAAQVINVSLEKKLKFLSTK